MTIDVSTQTATLDGPERIAELLALDPQLQAAAPRPEVMAAARVPSLRLAEVLATFVDGYGDHPALGSRVRAVAKDASTGRDSVRLLPEFETTSYRELWSDVTAVASAWSQAADAPVRPGDFVATIFSVHMAPFGRPVLPDV